MKKRELNETLDNNNCKLYILRRLPIHKFVFKCEIRIQSGYRYVNIEFALFKLKIIEIYYRKSKGV